ncbi:hypothetical protein [Vibrio scophthalmi]|nr:hypothetical protein [Vibrio scophthalmi]
MDLVQLLTSLNDVGMSPAALALIAVLWKQERRLTIIETMLKDRKHG